MRKRLYVFGGLCLVVGLSVASPASAFPGQGSCGDAAREFTAPLAQSGEFGELASTLGRAGQADDITRLLHMTLCEPRP